MDAFLIVLFSQNLLFHIIIFILIIDLNLNLIYLL